MIIILAILIGQVKLIKLYHNFKQSHRHMDGSRLSHNSEAGRVNWWIFLERKSLKKHTFQFNPLILLTGIHPEEISWISDKYSAQRC